LIPEGICAVLAVALIYRIVAPRFGSLAGLVSAFFAGGCFPSFVAVCARQRRRSAVEILLMLAACGAGLAAIDSGGCRESCGVRCWPGLAFNTSRWRRLLCVPGSASATLVVRAGVVAAGASGR